LVVIESVRAYGFRRLKLDHPLSFNSGLTVVRGHNEAGKSSLIEAILYGLYGDSSILISKRLGYRRVEGRLDEVVNHGLDKMRIEVVFRVGSNRYKVYREVERQGGRARQTVAEFEDLTSKRLLASGPMPVQDQVERLIGLSWREMLVTNIVAQKDLDRIITLTQGERESIINMMMGLEVYNEAVKRMGSERSELSKELRSKEELLKEKERQLQDLERLKENLENMKKRVSEIQSELPEKRDFKPKGE